MTQDAKPLGAGDLLDLRALVSLHEESCGACINGADAEDIPCYTSRLLATIDQQAALIALARVKRPPPSQPPPRYMICPRCGNDLFRFPAPSNIPTCTSCFAQVARAECGEALDEAAKEPAE